MFDQKATTTVHIGRIQGIGGAISVSYSPERGWIQIYAHDPEDLRKSGIFVGLSNSDFQDLKAVLSKVDEAIEAEVRRRLQGQTTNSEQVQAGDGCVIIAHAGSNVSLPENLYEEAAKLVAAGSTMLAASLISKALSWISLSGAKELAQTICEHQQATGIRK